MIRGNRRRQPCRAGGGHSGGTTPPAALLEEIKANLQAASAKALELVRRFLHQVAKDPAPLLACPARDALKLAIWPDKSRIAAEEIQRLSPLWGQVFRLRSLTATSGTDRA